MMYVNWPDVIEIAHVLASCARDKRIIDFTMRAFPPLVREQAESGRPGTPARFICDNPPAAVSRLYDCKGVLDCKPWWEALGATNAAVSSGKPMMYISNLHLHDVTATMKDGVVETLKSEFAPEMYGRGGDGSLFWAVTKMYFRRHPNSLIKVRNGDEIAFYDATYLTTPVMTKSVAEFEAKRRKKDTGDSPIARLFARAGQYEDGDRRHLQMSALWQTMIEAAPPIYKLPPGMQIAPAGGQQLVNSEDGPTSIEVTLPSDHPFVASIIDSALPWERVPPVEGYQPLTENGQVVGYYKVEENDGSEFSEGE